MPLTSRSRLIAVLHNIRSMHNVGSILRTADAVGVEKIYITGITPSPLDEMGTPRKDIAKVALGGAQYVQWDDSVRSTAKLKTLLRQYRDDGYCISAVEQHKKSTPYHQFRCPEKMVLIMGSETRGLNPAILTICDVILEIPMLGKKESLNVAVAFGIIAYYLRFQSKPY